MPPARNANSDSDRQPHTSKVAGRPRVLMVNDTGDLLGGAERGALLLLRHLIRSGAAVTALFFSDGELVRSAARDGATTNILPTASELLEPRETVLRSPVLAVRLLRSLQRASRAVGSEVNAGGFDVVYTFSMKGHLIAAASANRHRARWVCDVRELSKPYWFGHLVFCVASRIRASHVIVHTAQARAMVQRWLPAERISMINNFIDIDTLDVTSTRRHMRDVLGLRATDVVAISAGRMSPVKGFDVLISALQQVPELTLLICGEATYAHEQAYEKECRAQVARAGLEDRVHFLGQRADLVNIVNAADIAVLASRHEQQSRFAIEAMSLGLPLVATDVGGMKDLVGDAATGRIVASEDSTALARALDALRRDPALRARLGKAASARIRKLFSVQSSLHDTMVAVMGPVAMGRSAESGQNTELFN